MEPEKVPVGAEQNGHGHGDYLDPSTLDA